MSADETVISGGHIIDICDECLVEGVRIIDARQEQVVFPAR